MSNIERYTSSTLSRRTSRTVSRELSSIDGRSNVRLARIEAEAEIQAAKGQAVGYVGTKAMQATAMLSQIEAELTKAVPLAANRLESLGNLTALAMSEVVVDTVHVLRRV